MNAYSIYQDEVLPILERINEGRKRIISLLDVLPFEQDELIKKAQREAETQKESFNCTLNSIRIFIRMGSGGEKSEPSNAGWISNVDLVKLKRLSVSDPADRQGHQPKLFLEASAQYQFIVNRIKAIDSQLQLTISQIKQEIQSKKSELTHELEETEAQFLTAFKTVEFQKLINAVQTEKLSENNCCPIMGFVKVHMPISQQAADFLHSTWPAFFDAESISIYMVYMHDLCKGGVYWIETDKQSESSVIDGIQNIAIHAAATESVEMISFFDPVRYNDELMGALSQIAGKKDSPVSRAPLTDEEIEKRVQTMRAEIIRWCSDIGNDTLHRSNRVLIFYQFPNEYSNDVIKNVRFLCMNALRFGFTILLVSRDSNVTQNQSKDMDFIHEYCVHIVSQNRKSTLINRAESEFSWVSKPKILPDTLSERLQKEKNTVDLSNIYEDRIGFDFEIPKKGNRWLSGIPYGIDSNGNIATLSFEDELFGTFICGAARSGKTTLLHTIISGLLTYHPDDIEMWLIDFKKVEFAQYLIHKPPHVRYVILENSPEIIFDIIDELTKKMQKRKDIFKANGWTKVSDVPVSRSMPEVVVIIDEFSEMSGVLTNSVSLSGNGDDYREKFRLLFSEGASLGFRFILSCQAFSEGTRGLAEFAKMQIQQRIVMKSQRSEIKGTLDITSLSDEDTFLIENIEPHYALQRVPIDVRGNRLKKVHVLYIDDKPQMFSWIEHMKKQLASVCRYVADDNSVYGDKRPVYIDGSSYYPFCHLANKMKEYISNFRYISSNDSLILFIGAALRMESISPIHLLRDYNENLLIVSSSKHNMILSSILLSSWKSVKMQVADFAYLSIEENALSEQLKRSSQCMMPIEIGKDRVLEKLERIYELIEHKINGNSLIVIYGLEQLMREIPPSQESISLLSGRINFFGSSHLDNMNADSEQSEAKKSIDYQQIIKTLLAEGALYGYHFVLVFNSASAYTRIRLPDTFRHKILFRSSIQDVQELMIPSAQAAYYSTLSEFEYRYTNGLDKNTYRPFFHPLLSWDNLVMDEEGVIQSNNNLEDDDYLV